MQRRTLFRVAGLMAALPALARRALGTPVARDPSDVYKRLGADSDEGNRVFRSDVDKDQSSAKLAISLLMDYRHESREGSGQVILFRLHCGS